MALPDDRIDDYVAEMNALIAGASEEGGDVLECCEIYRRSIEEYAVYADEPTLRLLQ
jgi:hypothetical protein